MGPKNTRIVAIAGTVVIAAAVLIGLAALATVPAALPASTDATAIVSGSITPAEYTSQYVEADAPHLLLDVRTAEEYAGGHLAEAVNISLPDLEARIAELPTDTPIVVYCRSGNRSAQAAELLRGAGFTRVVDLGGITAWQEQGYPVVQ